MSVVAAYNASDSPVITDAAGHTVAGRDWAAVDDSAPEVQAAVAEGLLLLQPDLKSSKDTSEAAKRALADVKAQSGGGS